MPLPWCSNAKILLSRRASLVAVGLLEEVGLGMPFAEERGALVCALADGDAAGVYLWNATFCVLKWLRLCFNPMFLELA